MRTIHKTLWKASKKKMHSNLLFALHRCQTLPGSAMWILQKMKKCHFSVCSRIFMKLLKLLEECLGLSGTCWVRLGSECAPRKGKAQRGQFGADQCPCCATCTLSSAMLRKGEQSWAIPGNAELCSDPNGFYACGALRPSLRQHKTRFSLQCWELSDSSPSLFSLKHYERLNTPRKWHPFTACQGHWRADKNSNCKRVSINL